MLFNNFVINESAKMRETITPHKISMILLIKTYGDLKHKAANRDSRRPLYDTSVDMELNEDDNKKNLFNLPKNRRNFAIGLLDLIQGPDISLESLCIKLRCKYEIEANFFMYFLSEIGHVLENKLEAMYELMQSVENFTKEPSLINPTITKNSIIGLFIRRNVVIFNKLSCSDVVSLCKAFNSYIEIDRNSDAFQIVKCLDKSNESIILPPVINESMQEMLKNDNEMFDKDFMNGKKDWTLWTRKQAEYFLSKQAQYLVNNEAEALPPEALHLRIKELLEINPNRTEAYFLLYLNYLRVKDFSGALHSLYECFDRGAGFNHESIYNKASCGPTDDRGRSYRYGALNLAILQAHFGFKGEARSALTECIKLSHGASCNYCLQHALCWLYRLSEENQDILMERSISRSKELQLYYLTSLGTQSLAEYLFTRKYPPYLTFQILTASGVLNSTHSIQQLHPTNNCLNSIFWSLYGYPTMSSLYAQTLLNSKTQDLNSEATCLAICQMAAYIMSQGSSARADLILNHAKQRFSHKSEITRLCEQIIIYDHLVRQGQWQQAKRSVDKLAIAHPLESTYRQAELRYLQGDGEKALELAVKTLDNLNTNYKELDKLPPNFKTKVLSLLALIMGKNNRFSGIILIEILQLADANFLKHTADILKLNIAQHLLELGYSVQAHSIIRNVISTILAHGSIYEHGEVLLLFAKSKIASSSRNYTIDCESAQNIILVDLENAKSKFKAVEAVNEMRECLLTQILLSHKFMLNDIKFKYALELRLLDERTKVTPM